MRIAFSVLVVIHALIHLLGFVKGFGFAPVAQLSASISRPVGVLWLTACGLLLVAVGMLTARHAAWWMPAAVGLLLSQALVFTAWSDAKFGTLANVLLVVGVAVGFGVARFERVTHARADALVSAANRDAAPIESTLPTATLPPAVRRYLERSGVVGHAAPRTVRLQQSGSMQLSPGQGFLEIQARQYVALAQPAFLWHVKLAMFGVPIVGRDTYERGRGRMRIDAGGLVPVVDAADAKIDQGALLRYLGESVWYPAAALGPHITWEAGADDQREARATMRYEGVEASADFTFDDDGRFVSLRADRYQGGGEAAVLRPWSVRASAWSHYDVHTGEEAYRVEVPSEGDVVWHEPEGEFVFFRWTLRDLAYDVDEPYPRW
ncbi:MAG: hypothetical protein H6726_02245 [Sandaracinaceae bacterium]|nr:hypothetical protein [Sandaracinaceae bacterium]